MRSNKEWGARALSKYISFMKKKEGKHPKLGNITWRQIGLMYKFRPKKMTLDHIIPLNGDLVSGLHVPWNFQYLSEKDNVKKNNSFDGTRDNEGWRK